MYVYYLLSFVGSEPHSTLLKSCVVEEVKLHHIRLHRSITIPLGIKYEEEARQKEKGMEITSGKSL